MSSAQAERFAADLARLWPESGRLGLAVSGGPDSLALLLLAQAAMPGRFEAATVDHGLRAESAGEAAFVGETCAKLGVPHEVLPVDVGAGNVQNSARIARYAGLSGWAKKRKLGAIATAHHADDQAETLVMRLNRASGLSGLAGVRARGAMPGTTLPLLRPLLDWRRDELAEIVDRAGIEAVRDPSNVDERFDRVRIRQALADAPWLDVEALASSAGHLADAEDALRHYQQLLLERHGFADRDVAGISEPHSLTREGQLRLVRWAFAELGSAPRGGEIARLLDRLLNGKGGNLGGVLASVEGDAWIFRPEPPRAASSRSAGRPAPRSGRG